MKINSESDNQSLHRRILVHNYVAVVPLYHGANLYMMAKPTSVSVIAISLKFCNCIEQCNEMKKQKQGNKSSGLH
ncbi:hypothetical protein TSUD_256480 [Trifolium subterraneum]|uniref:Uncharacterized protein n=1 Tax=Trifolium subterraneum TaxID=3900 RepID=A0A2Z6MX86_TRISU|nr:hypothetical protein TSUD_256480 [Trifolium subterraneum]